MDTTLTTAVLAGVAGACALLGLLVQRRPGSRLLGALLLLLLTCAAVITTCLTFGAPVPATDAGHVVTAALVVAAALAAVAGGGPLTSAVFALVDAGPDSPLPANRGVRSAGDVLRGGAWIGALERTAVFASLVCGWPEGMALTLALKGLGRYPELRNEEHSGIAERFLIGTFTSVLWACAWAGIVLVVRS